MLYTDHSFLLLFAILWLACKLLRPWPVVKEWLLIAASFGLIATWGLFDVSLFATVLFLNYWGAVFLDRATSRRSRWILVTFIVLDIVILLTFKYANFFKANVSTLTGWELPKFPLGIPIAISFYTFHLISYLVDLQARRIRIASIRGYLFYLTFFPHVIAGPIVRAWQLVPQIGRTRRVRADLAAGFHFLVTGYFFKMVVANNIAQVIDPLWYSEYTLKPLECWIVAFLYYCQIYGDFAGYSLMALGMARLLGYRLPANFRSPLRALSMQEFWQRWHITLSRWLRDYLYIPLGGNRGSSLASARNVGVTMLLGGLWHGAGWGFVFWGALHGSGIVIERFLGMANKSGRLLSRLAWGVVIQLWVTIAWVFFRLPDFSDALPFVQRMLDPSALDDVAVRSDVALGLLYAVPVLAHNFFPLLIPTLPRKSLAAVLGVSTALMLLLNIVIVSPNSAFIYFRF